MSMARDSARAKEAQRFIGWDVAAVTAAGGANDAARASLGEPRCYVPDRARSITTIVGAIPPTVTFALCSVG
jgi:hypothetical protein